MREFLAGLIVVSVASGCQAVGQYNNTGYSYDCSNLDDAQMRGEAREVASKISESLGASVNVNHDDPRMFAASMVVSHPASFWRGSENINIGITAFLQDHRIEIGFMRNDPSEDRDIAAVRRAIEAAMTSSTCHLSNSATSYWNPAK